MDTQLQSDIHELINGYTVAVYPHLDYSFRKE